MENYQDDQERKPTEGSQIPTDAPSYVYPDPGYPVYSTPPAAPQQPPDKNRKGHTTKVIGLVALMLAVAIILSAVTGSLVYTVMKNRPNANQTVGTTTAETTDNSASPAATDKQVAAGETNKNFNLEDAASKHEDGKTTLTTMEIAAKGKPAVVAITTEATVTDLFGQTGQAEAAGSGFILTSDGYLVTNNHVIEGASTITVVLDNGDIYNAKLVGADSRSDIAVLKIDATNLPTVTLGDSADLEVGELAVAIGNPLGELSGTVTAGIISALDRDITLNGQTMNLLQTDAAINSGNSGGALFNSFGEVIGINTAKNSGTGIEGLGFAIPIDDAKTVIESLIKNGYVQGRPKIGISARDVSAQMAQYYNLTEGIYVAEVESGSSADTAGVKAEDIIIAANGKETLTIAALNEIKNQLKPGDTMELTLVRNGKQMKVTLTLKEDVPTAASESASRTESNLPTL
ncbi:MAG: trypsin-like peptidase domain-containing protein [Clostridiaceae bacterium]|nr:trypsin-like peptidase domain-containing protein [Clostridiaceae bacterium]